MFYFASWAPESYNPEYLLENSFDLIHFHTPIF